MRKHISESIITGVALSSSPIQLVLPITGRALIFAVLVNQTAGNLDGYNLQLYSEKAACDYNYPTVDTSNPVANASAPVFQVLAAPITVAGANAAGAFRDSLGVPYVNNACSIAGRVDEIYVQLNVTSPSIAKTFDVRIVYAEAD